MKILAIDPGNIESAYVLYDTETKLPLDHGKVSNSFLRAVVSGSAADHCAIEMVASYGMPVGSEVFDTCVAIGHFECLWNEYHPDTSGAVKVFRKDVKMHLCGVANAKDSNIKQRLWDIYGPGKAKAVGLKKSPGPLYGFNVDTRAALGVAITYAETVLEQGE